MQNEKANIGEVREAGAGGGGVVWEGGRQGLWLRNIVELYSACRKEQTASLHLPANYA